jgi:hypothetical protein
MLICSLVLVPVGLLIILFSMRGYVHGKDLKYLQRKDVQFSIGIIVLVAAAALGVLCWFKH